MMATVDLRRRKRKRVTKSELIFGASPKTKSIKGASPNSERILCESACDNFNIKNKIPTFNKTGRAYLIFYNLRNQKTAPSNESDSIDSYESSTRVEGYSSTSSVESPDPSFSISKCIDVLKTMGLDEDFYVTAVSWLMKSVDNREGFLELEPEFRVALLRKNI
ncbi:hypothetical protein L1049_028304 [Liquidambar formosana]|uniref:Uncharacterized protein n=1 Tax=Liquidambar formosana TaxID=63359 RepID=A0AAP0RK70_LIQFO